MSICYSDGSQLPTHCPYGPPSHRGPLDLVHGSLGGANVVLDEVYVKPPTKQNGHVLLHLLCLLLFWAKSKKNLKAKLVCSRLR